MRDKFKGVQKMTDNPFLNLYHIDAVDTEGRDFNYYFASRNDENDIKMKTHDVKPEGIVIYGVKLETEPKLVLIKQYRYPLDAYIYELPAGLVDGDETPAEAAVREMREETGLEMTVYEGGAAFYRRPFYMGPGFTDEMSSAVFGTVTGTPNLDSKESTEDIQVILADRSEVRRILSEEQVSLRGAYLMTHFLEEGDPLGFLEK